MLDLIEMIENIEKEFSAYILKKELNLLYQKQHSYVKPIYNKYKISLNLDLVDDKNYGLNFIFISNTGKFFFPSYLWRVLSFKDTKDKISLLVEKEDLSFRDLQFELFDIIQSNIKMRNGLRIETLESLYFYTKNFIEFSKTETYSDIFDYVLDQYNPVYYKDFKKLSFKQVDKNCENNVFSYAIPKNKSWNLGAFIIEPFSDYDLSQELPILPYYLVDKDENLLFSLHRISPSEFSNKFVFKDKIITNLSFFISLNSLINKKSKGYLFYLPDLFKKFEMFESQGFEYNFTSGDVNNLILSPNWELAVEFPQKSMNTKNFINNGENDQINEFLLENLDLIAYIFNSNPRNRYSISKIMIHETKENIFGDFFLNRLRIDNYNQKLIQIFVWVKYSKKNRNKYISRVTNFLKTIFPFGIIIEYQTGTIFIVNINKTNQNNLESIKDFLNLFNFEFQIFIKFVDRGFLIYSLPAANYWQNDHWALPVRKLKTSNSDYSLIINNTLEKEKKFISKKVNKKKYKDFLKIMNNLKN